MTQPVLRIHRIDVNGFSFCMFFGDVEEVFAVVVLGHRLGYLPQLLLPGRGDDFLVVEIVDHDGMTIL